MRCLEPFGEASVARNSPGSRESASVSASIQAEVVTVALASLPVWFAAQAPAVISPKPSGRPSVGWYSRRVQFFDSNTGSTVKPQLQTSQNTYHQAWTSLDSLGLHSTTSFHPMPALPLSDLLPRTGADSDNRQVGCPRCILNPEVVLGRRLLALCTEFKVESRVSHLPRYRSLGCLNTEPWERINGPS
ncbi:hypothetical protein CSOJ01_06584 [Colletotrichum sojae]|uniref:Uncharacterized protein n=1 Tax=Colletotrichum sojae TaxID=2175907 RepID=A0A8H6MVM5_9PEZI|nr:hypothetical protein CSOJ01_06584 [Colletotrichum sojae]